MNYIQHLYSGVFGFVAGSKEEREEIVSSVHALFRRHHSLLIFLSAISYAYVAPRVFHNFSKLDGVIYAFFWIGAVISRVLFLKPKTLREIKFEKVLEKWREWPLTPHQRQSILNEVVGLLNAMSPTEKVRLGCLKVIYEDHAELTKAFCKSISSMEETEEFRSFEKMYVRGDFSLLVQDHVQQIFIAILKNKLSRVGADFRSDCMINLSVLFKFARDPQGFDRGKRSKIYLICEKIAEKNPELLLTKQSSGVTLLHLACRYNTEFASVLIDLIPNEKIGPLKIAYVHDPLLDVSGSLIDLVTESTSETQEERNQLLRRLSGDVIL